MRNGIYILVILIMVSCSHTPPRLPTSWEAMPNHIETKFPESRYLAFQGQAYTKAEAEENALEELRKYFITRVNQNFINLGVISNQEGNVEKLVDYYLELFIVQYAVETNSDIYSKDWVVTAFIDRDRAWQAYEPRYKVHVNNFSKLFMEAENEKDLFQKALKYSQALKYSLSVDFIIEDLFGQLLHPMRMNDKYLDLKMNISKLPQLRQNVMWNANIYIYCNNDFESIIYNAFFEGFRAKGFPVINEREKAVAVCEVDITDDYVLKAVVTGESGVIDSMTLQAVNRSDKRTAYLELADKVMLELRDVEH